MIRSEKKREDIYINVTPMIDVMIFLIVFFLVATNFAQKEREQDVLLPEARGTKVLSKALESNLIINVKKDGQVVVNGRKIGERDLQDLIARRHEATSALKVKVRADKRTPYGDVATVLATVERAGVSRPYIDTKQDLLEP